MGIEAKNTFDYEGHLITIRPLSSAELDDAETKGYDFVSPNLARLIMLIRLKKVSLLDELNKIPADLFVNADKYYREIDYWIVYYSMKDFQPEDFTIEDVRKMRHVHDIAMNVLDMSSAPEKRVKAFINTTDGLNLMDIVYNIKIPLTDKAWKLTPLQMRFYELSKNGPSQLSETTDSLDQLLYGFPLEKVLKKIVK